MRPSGYKPSQQPRPAGADVMAEANAQLAGGKRSTFGDREAADPPAVIPALAELADGAKRHAPPRAAAEIYDGSTTRDYDGWVVYQLAARHGLLHVAATDGVTIDGAGTRNVALAGRMRAVGLALEGFSYRPLTRGETQDDLTLVIDVMGVRHQSVIPASGDNPEWRPFDLSGVDPELIERGVDRLRRRVSADARAKAEPPAPAKPALAPAKPAPAKLAPPKR